MAPSGFMLRKEQVANDALISITVRPFDSRMDWKQDLDLKYMNTLQVSQACKSGRSQEDAFSFVLR